MTPAGTPDPCVPAILARCDELERIAEISQAAYGDTGQPEPWETGDETPTATRAHTAAWEPKKVLTLLDGIRDLVHLREVRDGYGGPMLAILARTLGIETDIVGGPVDAYACAGDGDGSECDPGAQPTYDRKDGT